MQQRASSAETHSCGLLLPSVTFICIVYILLRVCIESLDLDIHFVARLVLGDAGGQPIEVGHVYVLQFSRQCLIV